MRCSYCLTPTEGDSTVCKECLPFTEVDEFGNRIMTLERWQKNQEAFAKRGGDAIHKLIKEGVIGDMIKKGELKK